MSTELELANINDKALQHTRDNATAANESIAVIDEKYGDGMPYEENRILFAIRENMSSYAKSLHEMGRYLILLKAHTPHGHFKEKIDLIDIPYGLAKQAVYIASRIDINGKTAVLLEMNKTKVLELAKEDIEDLDDLVDGGTLAGKTLDEFDEMTTRELHTTLRENKEKHKQDIEAIEQIVARKDKNLNEQSKQINKLSSHTKNWDETAKNFNAELTTIYTNITENINRLDQMAKVCSELNFEFSQRPKEEISISPEAANFMQEEYTEKVAKVFLLVMYLTQDVDLVFNSQIIASFFDQGETEVN